MARLPDEFLKQIQPFTKASVERSQAMADAVQWVRDLNISGDIVECGVWRGGQIMIARKLAPDRTCWLYDTFAGMTRPTELDVKRSGRSALESYEKHLARGDPWAECSVDEVRSNLVSVGLFDETKCKFVAGPVEKTLTDPKNLPEEIAVLRLDTDWYESTKVELEVLYPRLVKGGVLIIDDYGHWMGARKAVDDYFDQVLGKPFIATQVDYTAFSTVKEC